MITERPKRQHYVPKFYLEHFADADGLVWTYDTQSNNVRANTAENTAVQTNFYSVQNAGGEYNDAIEQWLSGVEGKAAPLYPKLLRGEVLDGQEKADFAVFLSSLFTRSPAMIRAAAEISGFMAQHLSDAVMSDRGRFDQVMDRVDAERGNTTTKEQRDAVFEYARDKSRYTIAVDRTCGLMALGATDRLTAIFFRMGWNTIDCSTDHLVTSDNPLARLTPPEDYHPIYGDGAFLNERTYVTVPLTPTRMLEMSWKGQLLPGLYPADKQRVRLYNRQRAHFAERYLFASMRDGGIRALGQKYKDKSAGLSVSGQEHMAPVEVRRKLT